MKELSKLYCHFQEPPPNALPQGSVSLKGAAETQFQSSADSTYEVCQGKHELVHGPWYFRLVNMFL